MYPQAVAYFQFIPGFLDCSTRVNPNPNQAWRKACSYEFPEETVPLCTAQAKMDKFSKCASIVSLRVFFLPHSFIEDVVLQGTKFYAGASACLQTAWSKVQQLLKSKILYDPAISLLGINPDKTIIQKDPSTPMFTGALFTTTKMWKQCKCPLTGEWIKKMWYMPTTEYYSAMTKNERPFAANWTDLKWSY